MAGLGVALVERRMVGYELAAGRLLAPCGFPALPERLAALPIAERGRSETARIFVAWLRTALADDPDP